MYSTADAGVLVFAKDGTPVFANDEMQRQCGYRFDEFGPYGGEPLTAGMGADDELRLFRAVALGVQSAGTVSRTCRKKDGSVYCAEVFIYAHVSPLDKTRYLVRFSREILPTDVSASCDGAFPDRAHTALQLVSQAVFEETGLPELMGAVHSAVRSLMPADGFAISLTEGPGTEVTFPYYSDARSDTPQSRMFNDGITEYVYHLGRPFRAIRETLAALKLSGSLSESVPDMDACLAVPLRTFAGAIHGVMLVKQRHAVRMYTDEDERLLSLVSSYVAAAIHSARQQKALRESEARFRAVFEHSGLGIGTLDRNGILIQCNSQVGAILGFSSAELQGKHMSSYIAPEERERSEAMFEELVEGKREHFSLTKQYVHADGSVIWCKQTVTAARGQNGEFRFAVSMVEDITEHKLEDDRLMYLAYHDGLTGLPNRSLFRDRLESSLKRAKRHEQYSFAVLFMDLDRFKQVNDSMGHEAGDELLVQFARRISGCLRDADTLARFGGDEFAVLLDDLEDPMQASTVLMRLKDEATKPFVIGGRKIYSGISIGAVLRARRYDDITTLLRDADTAMYHAKAKGRDYAIFELDCE